MTFDTVKRLHEHFTELANGVVKRSGVHGEIVKKGDKYDDLVISDAKRHLAKLEEKFPELKVKEVKEVKKESKK